MLRGGARVGAGRPKGCSKFGEKTKPMRVPISMVNEVTTFINNQCYQLPLYSSSVSAGFPSPADDHMSKKLDLNEHLIKHPAATFFVRAKGDSMINAGIHDGDILIVDRSIEATNGKIIIIAINGELTVKRLIKTHNKIILQPENSNYPEIEIKAEQDLMVWGVVTTVLHSV